MAAKKDAETTMKIIGIVADVVPAVFAVAAQSFDQTVAALICWLDL